MNERLKILRKSLNLTQKEFGEKIGIKGNTITTYEKGIRTPSEAIIFSICREFNVNENWLRTGEGEMFLRLNNDEEFELICEYIRVKDPIIKEILLSYWRLPDEQKAGVKEFIRDVAKGINGLDV